MSSITNNNLVIKLAAFSTNLEKHTPTTFIRQFFISCLCKNISYVKEGHVEFEYELPDLTKCHCHFVEIRKMDKIYSICSAADCYLVLIDLEIETAFSQIEKVFVYIKDTCNIEKKVYIVGLYSERSTIVPVMKYDSLVPYIEEQRFLYEYRELKYDTLDDYVEIVMKIFKDMKDVKIKSKQDTRNKKKTIDEIDVDNSTSNCLIF